MKKKIILAVALPMLVASLAGCSGSDLKVVNKDSQFYGTIKSDPSNPGSPMVEVAGAYESATLTTYHLKKKGDIPYVELGELATALNEALYAVHSGSYTTSLVDKKMHFYSGDKSGEFILDAKADTIQIKNGPAFADRVLVKNNGLSGDYASYTAPSIKESEKTRTYMLNGSQIPEYDTYNFKQYGIDIYSKGDKYYVPFDAFMTLLFKDISISFLYNGSDFFAMSSLQNFFKSYMYSSNGNWTSPFGIFKKVQEDASLGEKFRFQMLAQRLKEGSETEMITFSRFLSLYDNGGATLMACDGTTYDPTKTIQDAYDSSHYTYTYSQDGKHLKIRVEQMNQINGEYIIHLDETRFGKGIVSKELSQYNYGLLRLMFDRIYGLKSIKGYTDAESFFSTAGVIDGLKSQDVAIYNDAFGKLIGAVDDGHTSYTDVSLYTPLDGERSVSSIVIPYFGPRLKELLAQRKEKSKARFDKYKELHPGEPVYDDPNFFQGLKFSSDNETAIITFDSFTHNQNTIENMSKYPQGGTYDVNGVRSAFVNSTTDGFSLAFRIITDLNKNNKVVKNVVFDLSNNGGGMIATMPYLSAFFSDDPHYTIIDTINGAVKDYHYKADLNGDGQYGQANDTFKGQFNFYMLTSGFSFSCGNCLPGIAKDAGVKIIGERSGGGVSPVGVYTDAYGTSFNISNCYQMTYLENGQPMQNDSGIPLDHEWKLTNGNWYDPNVVNTYIKGLQ